VLHLGEGVHRPRGDVRCGRHVVAFARRIATRDANPGLVVLATTLTEPLEDQALQARARHGLSADRVRQRPAFAGAGHELLEGFKVAFHSLPRFVGLRSSLAARRSPWKPSEGSEAVKGLGCEPRQDLAGDNRYERGRCGFGLVFMNVPEVRFGRNATWPASAVSATRIRCFSFAYGVFNSSCLCTTLSFEDEIEAG